MPVRKLPVVLAASGLAALALTGCSTGAATASAAACDGLAPSGPALSVLQADGALGELPEITLPQATKVPALERTVLIEGDGRQVTDLSQVVSVEVAFLTAAGGELIDGSTYDGAPVQTTVSSLGQSLTGLAEQLLCTKAGSRVAVAVPASDLSPETLSGLGLTEDQGMIAVIDIIEAELPRAEGDLVFNAGWGLPSVVRAPSGQPGIIVPDSAAPADTTVQTLIKGRGDALTEDDTVILHFSGVTWSDKTVFESTWDAGTPNAFSFAAMPAGFADALAGATVGSQLMVVLPEGSIAAEDAGTAPTDDTLVYVVDVLGTIAGE